MKAIYIFIFSIFISGLLSTGLSGQQDKKNVITLHASTKDISAEMLNKCASVMNARLKDFNSGNFTVKPSVEKKTIEVTLDGGWDNDAAARLLTEKGSAGFYETIDRRSIAPYVKGDTIFFSLLKSPARPGSSEIGCVSSSGFDVAAGHIKNVKREKGCIFAWTDVNDKGNRCLFALKTDQAGLPAIAGPGLGSSRYESDRILITLKPEYVKKWADITRNNLGHSIAIVLDGRVIYSPVVKAVIESGKVEITGNFTQNEGKYIAAMLNNGELPVVLSIIK